MDRAQHRRDLRQAGAQLVGGHGPGADELRHEVRPRGEHLGPDPDRRRGQRRGALGLAVDAEQRGVLPRQADHALAAGEAHAVDRVRLAAAERYRRRLGGAELSLQRAQGFVDHSPRKLAGNRPARLASGAMQVPSPAVAAVFEPVQTASTLEETVERLGTAIRLGLLGPGRPAAVGARPRRPARDRALDAAAGADLADRERPPDRAARPRRRDVRVRGAAAGREQPGGPDRRALARGARLPDRGRGRLGRARRRARDAGAPRDAARARRGDARRSATSRSTGGRTCSSTSASPRRRARRGCWRR